MSIYVGKIGRMVKLKCPASQQVSLDGEPTFRTTLEGRRVAQVPYQRGRRAWSVQLSDASTPEQVGEVMAFINGEWGVGPFIFVSADAPSSNMLSPDSGFCDLKRVPAKNIMNGGPMRLGEAGWAGRSYLNPEPSQDIIVDDFVPVIQGEMVTASAFVQGDGAKVRISWYDASGAYLSQSVSKVSATAGTARRSFVSDMPPTNAASCRIAGMDASRLSRPAITWTQEVLPWADGQGCGSAIIHDASRDLVMASRQLRGGRYSNLSFMVSEVG